MHSTWSKMKSIFLLVSLIIVKWSMALDPTTLPLEKKTLYVPPLQEVADYLNKGLKTNFAEVLVEVVDCPDLTRQPFDLASKGLGGNPKIVELGGPPYLLPTVQRDKVYDLRDIVKLTNSDPAFIIGAGAGPHPYIGVNCEGIYNLNIVNGTVDQHTRISKVDKDDNLSTQEILPNKESRIALLANLLFSEGKPGKVLKVYAKKRTGPKNFITSIRETLEVAYKDKAIGLGGAFLLKEGKAKQHVMRDFSKTPLENEDDLNNWLKFYNMSAPLIAVGTLTNGDWGLDLRMQHFHSFSDHNEAGHYHYDTTPDIVEYLGYFVIGEEMYRIDQPVNTHTWAKMTGKFLYFAYGSNLLAQRIHINNPSAVRAGTAKLIDYQLNFATYSRRWRGAAASIVPKKGSHVWGALWEIDMVHMESLDHQEGVAQNLYRPLTVEVETPQGKKLQCRTYQQTVNIAVISRPEDLPNDQKPSAVYLNTILKGASESGLPEDYQNFLKRIPNNGYSGEVDIGAELYLK